MEIPKLLSDTISLAANILTIVASSVAIYLFFVKGKEIQSAFHLLLNWSFQLTLTDLKTKLERLNEYKANEPTEVEEIRNILHEIAGQIRGNRRLLLAAPNLATRVENLAISKTLSEPRKRSMVSELRETLRNIEVNSLAPKDGIQDV